MRWRQSPYLRDGTAIAAAIQLARNPRIRCHEGIRTISMTRENPQLSISAISDSFHRPISSERREIRLLTLLGQNICDDSNSYPTLSFSLHHVLLDDAPKYTALSYTWGRSHPTKTIMINGQAWQVTVNLFTALSQLRRQLGNSQLWVDALCIDQRNNVEKSEQVQQMHNIFQRAEVVTACLGPYDSNDPEGEEAVSQFSKLGNAVLEVIHRSDMESHCTPEDKLLQLRQAIQNHLFPLSAIGSIFHSPYWSRIWVIQELFFAENVQFLYNGFLISDRVFHAAMIALMDKICTPPPGMKDTIPRVALVLNASSRRRNGCRLFPIKDLLDWYREDGTPIYGFKATDSRDLVFALLNMASDTDELGIYADYTMTNEEVEYRKGRAFIIRSSHTSASSDYSGETQTQSLSNWLPNFSITARRGLSEHDGIFSASTVPGSGPECSLKRDGHYFRGFRVGIVKSLGPRTPRDGWHDWFQDFEGWLRGTHISNPDYLSSVLWKLPIIDCEAPGIVHPSDLKTLRSTRDTYQSYLDFRHHPGGVCGQTSLQKESAQKYLKSLNKMGHGYKPFSTTDSEFLCLAFDSVREGDLVVVFLGGNMPCTLREVQPGVFRVVGNCYVHGIMDGEMMESEPEIESFVLC